MEAKFMLERGFVEMESSDLLVRGGASVIEKIFSKVKAIIDFIADYVPKFLSGFKDGFGVAIF